MTKWAFYKYFDKKTRNLNAVTRTGSSKTLSARATASPRYAVTRKSSYMYNAVFLPYSGIYCDPELYRRKSKESNIYIKRHDSASNIYVLIRVYPFLVYI